jgi:hypothetical protein
MESGKPMRTGQCDDPKKRRRWISISGCHGRSGILKRVGAGISGQLFW